MKLVKTVALAVALSTVAMGANAQINNNAMAGQPYAGVKVGQFDVDGTSKKATAYGVYGGYKFNENFGVELDFVGGEDINFEVGSTKYELNSKSYGAYGAYNYNFANTPFYAKGKLGFNTLKVESKATTGSSVTSGSNSDTGFAYGVGVGYSPNSKFGIEAEYSKPTSADALLTLGAHLKF